MGNFDYKIDYNPFGQLPFSGQGKSKWDAARGVTQGISNIAGTLGRAIKAKKDKEEKSRNEDLDLIAKIKERQGAAIESGAVGEAPDESGPYTAAHVLGRGVRPRMRGRIDERRAATKLGQMNQFKPMTYTRLGEPPAEAASGKVPPSPGWQPLSDKELYQASPERLAQELGKYEEATTPAPKPPKQIFAPAKWYDKVNDAVALAESAIEAGEILLSFKDVEGLIGPFDSLMTSLKAKFNSYKKGNPNDPISMDKAKADFDTIATQMRLDASIKKVFWNILRVYQGGRPTEFDYKKFEEMLDVMNFRTPGLAADRILKMASDAMETDGEYYADAAAGRGDTYLREYLDKKQYSVRLKQLLMKANDLGPGTAPPPASPNPPTGTKPNASGAVAKPKREFEPGELYTAADKDALVEWVKYLNSLGGDQYKIRQGSGPNEGKFVFIKVNK